MLEGSDKTFDVVASILDIDHVPSTGAHFGVDILRVGQVNRPIAGDLVVVIDHSQVVESQVAGKGNGLQPNTFLQACIPNHAPSVVRYKIITRPVKRRSQVLCRHCQTNRVGKTLTQWPGGHFDAFMLDLRMARAQGVFTVRMVGFELVERHGPIACEVKKSILEQTSVAVGKNKAVSVEVVRGMRCVSHHISPKGNTDGCHANGTSA